MIDRYDGTVATENPIPRASSGPERDGPVACRPDRRSPAALHGLCAGRPRLQDRPQLHPAELAANIAWDRSSATGGPDDLALALAQNPICGHWSSTGCMTWPRLTSCRSMSRAIHRDPGGAPKALLRCLSWRAHVLSEKGQPGRIRRRCPQVLIMGSTDALNRPGSCVADAARGAGEDVAAGIAGLQIERLRPLDFSPFSEALVAFDPPAGCDDFLMVAGLVRHPGSDVCRRAFHPKP